MADTPMKLLVDLATGEQTAELKTAKEVVFSPDWKLVAAAGETGFGSGVYSARLLEVVTDKEIYTLAKEKNWISAAAFSPDVMSEGSTYFCRAVWTPANGSSGPSAIALVMRASSSAFGALAA